jgi:hypothetical protein
MCRHLELNTLARNTSTRTRNFMAIGDRLAIIRQYTKTTSKEQFDRLIPHGLPAFESDLLIQVHVLARPFAQVSANLISPQIELISKN